MPSAIAEELTARFVYVTDQAANQLIGYTVRPTARWCRWSTDRSATGLFPVNLTIDPTGKLIYVVNYNANTVQGYAIDLVTGTPSARWARSLPAYGAGPTCVTVDPALGTSCTRRTAWTIRSTAERVNPNTGGLAGVQNSPFPACGTANLPGDRCRTEPTLRRSSHP